jgi:hypothetical protein
MSFILARAKSRSIPRVRDKALAAGAAFELGALLLVNASDEFAECGADPASIAAVAESGAGASTEIGAHLGKKEFPPGRMQGTWVGDDVEFRARYVGTLPGAAGGAYGVVRDTDSKWKVDFAETVNTRVRFVRSLAASPENVPEVIVTFLAANVQIM